MGWACCWPIHNIGIAVLWDLFIFVAAKTVTSVLQAATASLAKVAIAVLTGVFALIGAVVTHALNARHDRELDDLRRKRDSYASILNLIAPFVRAQSETSEALTTALLQATIVGTPRVASAVRAFLEDKAAAKLDEVLAAMRDDLDMAPASIRTTGLFPAKKTDSLGA